MNFEKDYISYLIKQENIKINKVLEKYLLNEISFTDLVKEINVNDIMTFQTFIKSKMLDQLFD
jgi:hypothetical protein